LRLSARRVEAQYIVRSFEKRVPVPAGECLIGLVEESFDLALNTFASHCSAILVAEA
jgi:hypothetical protein